MGDRPDAPPRAAVAEYGALAAACRNAGLSRRVHAVRSRVARLDGRDLAGVFVGDGAQSAASLVCAARVYAGRFPPLARRNRPDRLEPPDETARPPCGR